MGLLKISKHDHDIVFIYYNNTDKEVTLHSFDLNEKYLHTKINTESECVKRWAQNMQQTPEVYLSQFILALEEYTKDDIYNELCGASMNNFQAEDVPVNKTSIKQNSFELDEESNLIWKQFFKSKNILGRKGKFSLDERPRRPGLEEVWSSLVMEINDKENRIQRLHQEREKLIKEKDELRKIAEESVMMKEKFEREIFVKFSALLNTKKAMNCELRARLLANSSSGSPSPPRPSTSAVKKIGVECMRRSSDDEFEADTDVDSPEEVEIIENDDSNGIKRRGELETSESTIPHKKSKSKRSKVVTINPDSLDVLDASLDSDLGFGFGRYASKE